MKFPKFSGNSLLSKPGPVSRLISTVVRLFRGLWFELPNFVLGAPFANLGVGNGPYVDVDVSGVMTLNHYCNFYCRCLESLEILSGRGETWIMENMTRCLPSSFLGATWMTNYGNAF